MVKPTDTRIIKKVKQQESSVAGIHINNPVQRAFDSIKSPDLTAPKKSSILDLPVDEAYSTDSSDVEDELVKLGDEIALENESYTDKNKIDSILPDEEIKPDDYQLNTDSSSNNKKVKFSYKLSSDSISKIDSKIDLLNEKMDKLSDALMPEVPEKILENIINLFYKTHDNISKTLTIYTLKNVSGNIDLNKTIGEVYPNQPVYIGPDDKTLALVGVNTKVSEFCNNINDKINSFISKKIKVAKDLSAYLIDISQNVIDAKKILSSYILAVNCGHYDL